MRERSRCPCAPGGDGGVDRIDDRLHVLHRIRGGEVELAEGRVHDALLVALNSTFALAREFACATLGVAVPASAHQTAWGPARATPPPPWASCSARR